MFCMIFQSVTILFLFLEVQWGSVGKGIGILDYFLEPSRIFAKLSSFKLSRFSDHLEQINIKQLIKYLENNNPWWRSW